MFSNIYTTPVVNSNRIEEFHSKYSSLHVNYSIKTLVNFEIFCALRSKEYQEAHVAELQELKNAIESAEENNKQSKAKIAQLVNQLEETKRELGEMKQEECRQNENMKR